MPNPMLKPEIPAGIASVPHLISPANPDILVIAHRGLWDNAPENSLKAIRDAVLQGIEIVEIDAQATGDGAIVVLHDETLDRTTTASGNVFGLPLEIVRQARLKMGAGGGDAQATGERIPTLAEALEEARGRITVNIDTKHARDLNAVMTIVRDQNMTDQVIMKSAVKPSSGHFPVMQAEWFGKVPYMPLFKITPGRFAEDLAAIAPLAAQMVEVKFDHIDDLAGGREEMERRGIRAWVNTLDVAHNLDLNDTRALADPEGVWGLLIAAGVGAIQTDIGPAFKEWLSRREIVAG